MHFLPIVVFVSILKASLICAFGPRRLFQFLKDCVTVTEDHWTWTTRTGEWFEDAEIEAIEEGELVLKHRYGIVRLTIDALSEKSRYILFQTQKWTDHVASSPAADKIAAFAGVSSPMAHAA